MYRWRVVYHAEDYRRSRGKTAYASSAHGAWHIARNITAAELRRKQEDYAAKERYGL